MTPTERAMLADGAKQIGIELSEAELHLFDLFTTELARWNAKLNLTSLTNINDIISKHYLDSLTASSLIPTGARLLDMGSGGGFPCIPLKITRPDIEIVSVDSVQKKIIFQRQVARILGFDAFRAIHSRIENLVEELQGAFDVVIARAVSDVTMLARMALPYLADSGKLIAMKGSRWKEEFAQSEAGIGELGFNAAEFRELRLPVSGDERCLIVLTCKKT